MKKNIRKVATCLSICTMALALTACGNKDVGNQGANNTANTGKMESAKSEENKVFPKFTGKDLEGSAVDNSIFKEHAATVLNLWFTGCSACVSEMPDLETLNNKLKEKNVAVVGLLTEQDKNEEAKKILSTKGATYRNFVPDSGSEINGLLDQVFAFPTTYVIDRKGNIVGDPIAGTLNTEEQLQKLNTLIDRAISNDK